MFLRNALNTPLSFFTAFIGGYSLALHGNCISPWPLGATSLIPFFILNGEGVVPWLGFFVGHLAGTTHVNDGIISYTVESYGLQHGS